MVEERGLRCKCSCARAIMPLAYLCVSAWPTDEREKGQRGTKKEDSHPYSCIPSSQSHEAFQE